MDKSIYTQKWSLIFLIRSSFQIIVGKKSGAERGWGGGGASKECARNFLDQTPFPINHRASSVEGEGGGAVAQWVERPNSRQEILGSIHTPTPLSLLPGSISV